MSDLKENKVLEENVEVKEKNLDSVSGGSGGVLSNGLGGGLTTGNGPTPNIPSSGPRVSKGFNPWPDDWNDRDKKKCAAEELVMKRPNKIVKDDKDLQ